MKICLIDVNCSCRSTFFKHDPGFIFEQRHQQIIDIIQCIYREMNLFSINIHNEVLRKYPRIFFENVTTIISLSSLEFFMHADNDIDEVKEFLKS